MTDRSDFEVVDGSLDSFEHRFERAALARITSRLTTAERERDRFREALESEDVWCDCNEYRASTRAARGEQRPRPLNYLHRPGATLCGLVETLSVNGEQGDSRLSRLETRLATAERERDEAVKLLREAARVFGVHWKPIDAFLAVLTQPEEEKK